MSAPAATGRALHRARRAAEARRGRGLGRAVDVDERAALDVVRMRRAPATSRAPARSTLRGRRRTRPTRRSCACGSARRCAAFSAGHCDAVHLRGGIDVVEAERTDAARAGWRRTWARTTRSTRTRRRRSRTRCRSARRRRAGSCPRGPQPPIASRPKKMLISCALPSTIAASTTCPTSDVARSTSAARMPITTSEPPPPKSASRLIGGTGAPPSGPMCHEHARDREVVDVVADVVGERAVLAPTRHARVDEARIARASTRRARRRAARRRRAGSPRAARRPARTAAGPPRRRARASGRCRCCAGRGR